MESKINFGWVDLLWPRSVAAISARGSAMADRPSDMALSVEILPTCAQPWARITAGDFPRHWSLLSQALLQPKPSQPYYLSPALRDCLTTTAKAVDSTEHSRPSLWSPYVIGRPYIFSSCFFLLLSSSSFFSSPNFSGRRLDVYHTLAHGVALVRI